MALTVGELIGRLRIDDAEFTQGIRRGREEMGRFAKEAQEGSSRSSSAVGELGRRVTEVFVLDKVKDFALGMRDAAAGLEQSLGGTEAVFKDARGEIDAFAKDADEKVGLSERAFRDLTTVAGAQLKNLGFDLDEAASQSIKLTQIGADLAATYGGTTAEAVEALGAAFRGEADPAERFGLRLNINTANAKAVEMGLAASTSAVDDHARAQAVLALIMEQSADAQGQFAREADTAAGQAQIASAKWEDMQAKLGQKVLPAVMAVTGAFISLVDSGIGPWVVGGGLAVTTALALVGPLKTLWENAQLVGDALRRATTSMGGFGKVAGVAAGIGAAALALEQWNRAEQQANIDRLTKDFLAAGDSAKTMADVMSSAADKGPTEFIGIFTDLAETNREAAERFVDVAEKGGVASDVITQMRQPARSRRRR